MVIRIVRFAVFITTLLTVASMALPIPAHADGIGATVSTAPLASVAVRIQSTAPATVISLNEADISAEIAARIVALPVQTGSRVGAGDPLAQLDCRDARATLQRNDAQLSALQAGLQLARLQLKQARTLATTQTVSAELLEQRRTDEQRAAASLRAQQQVTRLARINTERCTPKAPFAGIVTRRYGNIGQYAAVGSPLVHLVDVRHVEVSAQIQATDGPGLLLANDIELQYGQRQWPVRLRQLLPVIDPQTRSREARLEFRSETPPPGASGMLVWHQAATAIPAGLLVQRDDRLGVFVVVNGRAKFVTLPDAIAGQPAVTTLPAETELIIDGRFSVSDGDAVQTEPAN